MTPSGVQKERILPDELFVVGNRLIDDFRPCIITILDKAGSVLAVPPRKAKTLSPPKLSDCAPLFLHAFQQRNAGKKILYACKVSHPVGAVLHSHSVWCNLATTIFEGFDSFRISHQEMIKGIAGNWLLKRLLIVN